jgi:hypothetical protein
MKQHHRTGLFTYTARSMDRRDKWIEKCQQMELDPGRELQRKNACIADLIARVRAPITGFALQEWPSTGMYANGWAACHVRFTVRPQAPVTAVTVRGWRLEGGNRHAITLSVDSKSFTAIPDAQSFEIRLAIDEPTSLPCAVAIDCEPRLVSFNDDRELAFGLIEVRVESTD